MITIALGVFFGLMLFFYLEDILGFVFTIIGWAITIAPIAAVIGICGYLWYSLLEALGVLEYWVILSLGTFIAVTSIMEALGPSKTDAGVTIPLSVRLGYMVRRLINKKRLKKQVRPEDSERNAG